MSASSSTCVLRPQSPPGASLHRLAALAGPRARRIGVDVRVTGVSQSSSRVLPGDLFAALPGVHQHGRSFVGAALAAGATAVLTDEAGAGSLPLGATAIVTPDPRSVVGPVAAEVYGQPSRSLDVVGITGTSGKTTTAFLVRAGLAAAGLPVGLLGTVGTFIGDEQLASGLTTPEAPDLQATLAVMGERGVRRVVMEVSSHALELHRVEGIDFAVAAFTNLSRDHLDFHRDMEAYFEAKARLFDRRSRRHLVVTDDDWGRRLAGRLGTAAVTVGSAGQPADWTATDVRVQADGSTTFTIGAPTTDGASAAGIAARCRIPGRFNVANAVLAVAVLGELGVPLEVAATAVGAAQVPGRMERIDVGQDFLAVVDYCHKPAAVHEALSALRPLTAGRLIIVLGCGGDRDREKRPMMGAVAARGADLLIVTDDNPRSEEPAAIRASMLDGVAAAPAETRAAIREVGDRGDAIALAVAAARAGDTVLIAGKGHETGQDVGGTIHPFDDRVVLRRALADRRPA